MLRHLEFFHPSQYFKKFHSQILRHLQVGISKCLEYFHPSQYWVKSVNLEYFQTSQYFKKISPLSILKIFHNQILNIFHSQILMNHTGSTHLTRFGSLGQLMYKCVAHIFLFLSKMHQMYVYLSDLSLIQVSFGHIPVFQTCLNRILIC